MSQRWIFDSEKTLFHSSMVDFIRAECHSSEDDRKHTFYLLHSADWCNVIPVTEDGKIVFVRQFRVGIRSHTLEIPGGVLDPEDKDPEAAAIREMAEETGYVPLPGACVRKLGWTHPNPAMLNNRVHLFAVGPVRKKQAQKLDHGEMIEVVEASIDELPKMIRDGKITHSLMLNAFFLLGLDSKSGAGGLVEELKGLTRC